jgi:hypothetical protein
MTLKDWSQIASDDVEFLECIGYALQEKVDLSSASTDAALAPRETAVLALWTYLAANPDWHPMPVAREEVIVALHTLSLRGIEPRIPADLRSPSADLACELLSAVAALVRADPEQLNIDDYLEEQRNWMKNRIRDSGSPLPADRMPAIYQPENRTMRMHRTPR